MTTVRHFLAWAVLLALVGAGTALAARGDPQEELTAADNARARSMVLRKADLGPGFKPTPVPKIDDDFYCRAIDESDLTLTGKAIAPNFVVGGIISVRSYADVYESVADANASWRRGTSRAGVECLRRAAVEGLKGTGARLVSFARRTWPSFAERSTAFRFVFESQGVRVYVDVLALQQSRAFVGLLFESGLAPVPKEGVTRVARIVEARMKTVMRRS